jgi:hypothetical protein
MEPGRPTRILVVANHTAAAPQLLDEVRRRAAQGESEFVLLIPDAHDRDTAGWTLEVALPLLARAAGAPVQGLVGGPEPLESVKAALATGEFDEIVVSTLPRRFSHWVSRDLIGRIEALGLPLTIVTPHGAHASPKQSA